MERVIPADPGTVDLSPAVFEALRNLSNGADPQQVPLEYRQQLIMLGYARKTGTEFLVTSAGRLRVMQGA